MVVDKRMFQLLDSCKDYKDAIRLASLPLLSYGYITDKYVQAMINSVDVFGAYIVLMPLLAMPHALPDSSVLKTGFSVLKLKEPVYFEKNNEDSKATVIIPIACCSNGDHISLISAIAKLFMDESRIDLLFKANTIDELYAVFDNFDLMGG